VIIVVAERNGAMLVGELERSPDCRVVALVDDDPAKQGQKLIGHQLAHFAPRQDRVLRARRVRPLHHAAGLPEKPAADAHRPWPVTCATASAWRWCLPLTNQGGHVATYKHVRLIDFMGATCRTSWPTPARWRK
jgi:hypothetical protein